MLLLGLVDVPLWLLLTLGIVIGLYWQGTRNHDYFQKMGIPGPRPWPFIGNLNILFSKGFYDMHLDLKKKYGKVYGFFSGSTPVYVTFDEEMISQVTVKQFQNFTERRSTDTGDPLIDHMITNLKGEHWKHVRSQMSPAFTTGKLRMMSEEINRGGKTFVEKLVKHQGPFEARTQAGAFTMDIIASTAFGLRVDAQEDEGNNAFIKNGKKMMDFSVQSFTTILFFLLPSLIPYLTKLGLTILDKDATQFFMSVVTQTMEGRSQNKDTSRGDFVQMMVKAKEGHDIRDQEDVAEGNKEHTKSAGLSKEEILSNALLFFLAGYDTTAVAVSQLMYLLATNQHCQDKLIQEVERVVGDKDVDYDTALKLPYLDQCIQETLRLYPPGVIVDRKATADTEVCGIKIPKGSIITIPAIGIHHDSEIWPEPETFDPERFSPENKPKISPFHYLPFGYGPRNCIGMRLALFEVKVAIASVLKTHRFMTCEKTEIPLKMSRSLLMKPENGIWIVVEKHE